MKRVSAASPKVPPPSPSMSRLEKSTWVELAAAIERDGTWQGDVPAFTVLVRSVALSSSTEVDTMPASAKVRLFEAAASMLANWGLTPAGRMKLLRERARAKHRAAMVAFRG